jgi:thiamine biosynthesis lipoprotein
VPLDTITPVLNSATFPAMGTTTLVAVADPAALTAALAAVREVIEAVDATCSRFKPSSELCSLNRAAGGPARRVSPLLGDAIAAALEAAASTNGLVDPTMGRLIERLGYSVTFGELPRDGPRIDVEIRAAPGWDTVVQDLERRTVQIPETVAIDLGAVGKAWAADRAARAAAQRTGSGILVSCGGDVALAGEPPHEGWCIRVAERPGAAAWQDVLAFDGGIATSGTGNRAWQRGGRVYHHILDPATGMPAASPWRTVTVAAASCAAANAAATAAIVLGAQAPAWLDDLGLPARLVDGGGHVVSLGAWPRPR